MIPLKQLKIIPIAPSSPFALDDYEAGLRVIRALGCHVEGQAPMRQHSFSYLNGGDAERIFELDHALQAQEASIVWAVRGGYGLTRILPLLEMTQNAPTPIVIGFSDSSALLLHLWAKNKRKGIHAPAITKIAKEPQESVDALALILRGQAKELRYPTFERYGSHSQTPFIDGDLIACNLCMLTHLIGTPSMPNLRGTILILEEVSERPYRIDRMLTHLWASGSLEGVKAVIVGHLTQCQENQGNPKAALDVFIERFTAFGVPIFGQIPIGHETPNWPAPFGVKAQIQIRHDEAELKILEEVIEPTRMP